MTFLIQKILHLIKSNPSNIIFVTTKKTGSRTIAKLVALLKNLTYLELGTNATP